MNKIVNNLEIMCHFFYYSKRDFLKIYKNLTDLDYNLIFDTFYSKDKIKILSNLYIKLNNEQNIPKRFMYEQCLMNIFVKLNNKEVELLREIINKQERG